ncbi:permease prefix domain 1-containing protein [Luteipulveratus mongoliensis]|uniref:permease prefix domain 1-containing protein n=1 Tax=Luteipulveratus mongoliensis TaxID=571913 RepID=UPI000696577D|nr:permease prefix domain 1-containing protein [Luteipulveratus mongoliensis]
MTPIDRYVDMLAGAVGSRRAVIVDEARDHLLDAAESWERKGYDRRTAEDRAIADFGAVDELAPGYRSVVALATARRTAVLVVIIIAVQPAIWSLRHDASASSPASLDALADLIGTVGFVLSVASMVLCSFGVRLLGVRTWMVTSVSAAAVLVALSSTILALAWIPMGSGTVVDLVIGVGTLAMPMGLAVWLAARSWRQVTGRVPVTTR